jgi:hypothetical protein
MPVTTLGRRPARAQSQNTMMSGAPIISSSTATATLRCSRARKKNAWTPAIAAIPYPTIVLQPRRIWTRSAHRVAATGARRRSAAPESLTTTTAPGVHPMP